MSVEIRFHLDENVPHAIAVGLRTHGINVTNTNEAQLRSASDDTQLDYARRVNRVLITHDTDFLRIAATTVEHPGIIFAEAEGRSIGKIVRECISLFRQYSAEEMRGRVEYL